MKYIGDRGEMIAIAYLQKNGYTICESNFKFGRFGEIDLIAKRSLQYHFIEVKYRKNSKFGSPEESITPAKLRKCQKTMEYYCKRYHIDFEKIQFDVIAIEKKETFRRVKHYKNIEIN